MAEEVVCGIRTVFAFGGEKVEIERYNDCLMRAEQPVRKKGILLGLREGILRFLYFSSSALAYWYGVQLVLDDRHKAIKEYTPTVMLIVRCQPTKLNKKVQLRKMILLLIIKCFVFETDVLRFDQCL